MSQAGWITCGDVEQVDGLGRCRALSHMDAQGLLRGGPVDQGKGAASKLRLAPLQSSEACGLGVALWGHDGGTESLQGGLP